MPLPPSRPGLRVGSGDARGERALAERIVAPEPQIQPLAESWPERNHRRVTGALLVFAFLGALCAVAAYASTLLSLDR